MSAAPLGRLEKVELRRAWENEAHDFTPWLAQPDNLALLGKAIGRDLEAHAKEQSVGAFKADILCREIATDAWVIIENQLEKTDHSHLGQLLTYAAGLNAVTIIWVAERFTDEHRAALDWLNQHTPEQIAFFGLEVELWRIGDSPLAPKFNVVCKPNDWARNVVTVTDTSDAKQFCRNFWEGVIADLQQYGFLRPETKPLARQDTRFEVGWHTFFLKAYFSLVKKKTQGVWVSCRGPHGYENYLALKDHQREIENAFGDALEWRPEQDRDQGALMHSIIGNDANERSKWPDQHAMIAEMAARLYRAVQPYVRKLDTLSEEVADE
jgi:hypothetical protein